MKKVLITGANSYVGTNVEKWLMREPDKYYVETLDMKDPHWKKYDFSKFDVIFHVAGIVHTKEKNNSYSLFNRVNYELTVEVATKAKNDGISQFVFMSTMAVYGLEGSIKNIQVIHRNTLTKPKTFYGITKLKAEEEIRKLQSNGFSVLIVRPPMIYGEGAPGNYIKLENLVKRIRIAPKFENQRSVISIDLFCINLKKYIDNCDSGVKFPQDIERFNFDIFVDSIVHKYNIHIYRSKLLSIIIRIFFANTRIVKKIFGNLIYGEDLDNE